jgi:hypothetical protein
LLKQHCQTVNEEYAVSLILLYAYKLQGIDDCLWEALIHRNDPEDDCFMLAYVLQHMWLLAQHTN